MIPDRGIHAEEAVGANRDATRDDDMRRHEDVVFDYCMMADVVATPEDNVVPDPDERLDRVVFQDEAVVTALEARKDSRT